MSIHKVKQIMNLQLKYFKINLSVLFGGFATGVLLAYIIVNMTKSDDVGRLGIMLSVMLFYMTSTGLLTYAMTKDYKSYVQTSTTRLNALVGIYSYHIVSLVVGTGLLAILLQLEYVLTALLYPTLPVELLLEPLFTDYSFLLPVIAFVVVLLATILAGVIHQFGMKGIAIIYFGLISIPLLFNLGIAQAIAQKMGISVRLNSLVLANGLVIITLSGIIVIALAALCLRSVYRANLT